MTEEPLEAPVIRRITRISDDREKGTRHVFTEPGGYLLTVPRAFRDRRLRVGATLSDPDLTEIRSAAAESARVARERRFAQRREERAPRHIEPGMITDIRVGRGDRRLIDLDGHFALAMSASLVESNGLRRGESLDAERIAALVAATEISHVGAMIDRLLVYRPRTATEIRARLSRRGLTGDAVEKAIERRSSGGGVLSDEDFAIWFSRARGSERGRGSRVLSSELHRLGVAPEAITAAREEYPEADALALAADKAARHLDLSDRRDAKRFIDRLMRRGFNYGDIAAEVRRRREGSPEILDEETEEMLDS